VNINKTTWEKLESEFATGKKIAARLFLPEVTRKLYAGLDANLFRHLLIPLDENQEEYVDSQSKGLSVSTKELIVQGSKPTKYIDIKCQDKSGFSIFEVIGQEIAERIDSGVPKEVVASVINKWRNFWSYSPKEILSRQKIIGLFAELWFFNFWLLSKLEKLEAVNRWRGPFSSRHDFEWSGTSVEVKATTNVKSRIHHINDVDQLLPPDDGVLFLFSLHLREEQGSQNSLTSLISLCRENIQDDVDALSKFENILAIFGYSPVYDEEYSKLKFRVVDQKLYSVKEGFPRIISGSFKNNIPNGVFDINYLINLDGFDEYCVATSPDDKFEF